MVTGRIARIEDRYGFPAERRLLPRGKSGGSLLPGPPVRLVFVVRVDLFILSSLRRKTLYREAAQKEPFCSRRAV